MAVHVPFHRLSIDSCNINGNEFETCRRSSEHLALWLEGLALGWSRSKLSLQLLLRHAEIANGMHRSLL